jgi:hypothetical protein
LFIAVIKVHKNAHTFYSPTVDLFVANVEWGTESSVDRILNLSHSRQFTTIQSTLSDASVGLQLTKASIITQQLAIFFSYFSIANT